MIGEELGPLWRKVDAAHTAAMRDGLTAQQYREAMAAALAYPAPTDEEEIANPRCGCSPETVRGVIISHLVCCMGGCPYGGDI